MAHAVGGLIKFLRMKRVLLNVKEHSFLFYRLKL